MENGPNRRSKAAFPNFLGVERNIKKMYWGSVNGALVILQNQKLRS